MKINYLIGRIRTLTECHVISTREYIQFILSCTNIYELIFYAGAVKWLGGERSTILSIVWEFEEDKRNNFHQILKFLYSTSILLLSFLSMIK